MNQLFKGILVSDLKLRLPVVSLADQIVEQGRSSLSDTVVRLRAGANKLKNTKPGELYRLISISSDGLKATIQVSGGRSTSNISNFDSVIPFRIRRVFAGEDLTEQDLRDSGDTLSRLIHMIPTRSSCRSTSDFETRRAAMPVGLQNIVSQLRGSIYG